MADRSGIKVTASDALEFESVAPKGRKGGGVVKTLIFVIVAVFAGASGWAFYGDRIISMFNATDGEVPVIRADISPIKVRPDNPGGLQVPDRDKLVYDRIQNGGGSEGRATVERLLPPPESPLPVPKTEPVSLAPQQTTQAPAPLTSSISNTPKLKDVEQAVKPGPAPVVPSVSATLNALNESSNTVTQPKTGPTRLAKSNAGAAPAPATALQNPSPAIPDVPAKPVVAAPAKSKTTTTAAVQPPSNKVYRVQLAAARTSEAARKEWDRLRRGNLDVLGDLGLSVTKIDLGGTKGIFYRLRAGPLKDDAQARALCKALAKRKIGCLVVRPGK